LGRKIGGSVIEFASLTNIVTACELVVG